MASTRPRQAPPENLDNLTAALPDARMQLFDGGHLFLLQDRAAWPAVVDFLREHGRARADDTEDADDDTSA